MRSHLLHMLLYATLVAAFFAVLLRDGRRARIRFGALLWVVMIGGGLALAWIMYPFPS